MADAALSALVFHVLERLTSAAIQQFGLLLKLEIDVSALRNNFSHIQAVLHDAEVKQRKQKAVEEWLRSLRSASLEVENVLDEVEIEAMLRRLHRELGIKYRVRAFFTSDHNRHVVRRRIAHKVKNIRRKLDDIAANRSKFDLTPGTISVDRVGGETLNRETSSLVHFSMICGRDAEMEMVTQNICNKDIDGHDIDDVQVYAIWGMGGMGKTTLAQLVYNHERVKTHFELKTWVHVSREFEVKKLIRGILEGISEATNEQQCELSQLDAMQVRLQNMLRGKRFFIMLDDVSIDDGAKWENWDELCKVLSCGAQGSIVMVTTQNQETSRRMAKFPKFQHEVGCLSDEDSWSLFKKLAFGVGRGRENIRELEPIGKEIVKKCKGLPLAVKTLGSLMWSKSSAIEWKRVKENDIWELEENGDYILPALKVSYDNLLPHLKRCFAYCCLFPKGYEMHKDLLIELWMANGFIPPRGEADLYTLGEEIFNCLIRRSFFQDVKGKYMDKICQMHDMMHDLARYVMRHDCSVAEPGKELIIPDEVLHLSYSCPDFLFLDPDLEKLRSLRSIFIFAHEYEGKISQISQHRYLRVLHLIGIGGMTLPESICKLRYLRYLNMSMPHINVIPESIIYLQNLQALLLRGCWNLHKLPEGMRYMRNLRCLDTRDCDALEYMPEGIKELAGLRRLSNFAVGEKDGARIGELGDLNLLGWGLELGRVENVGGLEDAKRANLKYKRNVTSLVLRWSKSIRSENQLERPGHDEEVLEGLEPNSSLKELEIWNYMGKKISPSWIVNLGNLVRIEFWWCENCESIPPLGKLASLKFIDIYKMRFLKCFHYEDNTTSGDDTLFPCLQELNIVSCLDLVSLPNNLPKLERLTIDFCERLVSLPSHLPKLKELDLRMCSGLVSLPRDLPKLRVLNIDRCPGLHSLPNGLKELTFLKICGCEVIRRRCKKEIGEDWPKISHVPHIDLR